jgi:hypothetical protein
MVAAVLISRHRGGREERRGGERMERSSEGVKGERGEEDRKRGGGFGSTQ